MFGRKSAMNHLLISKCLSVARAVTEYARGKAEETNLDNQYGSGPIRYGWENQQELRKQFLKGVSCCKMQTGNNFLKSHWQTETERSVMASRKTNLPGCN